MSHSQLPVCFCLLYRASPSLSAKNMISLILVLTIWWCPCVESSLVLWKRVFVMTSKVIKLLLDIQYLVIVLALCSATHMIENLLTFLLSFSIMNILYCVQTFFKMKHAWTKNVGYQWICVKNFFNLPTSIYNFCPFFKVL